MSGSSDHIRPLRLFDIGRESGLPITDKEREHLRDCEECQHIVEVFARQFDKPFRPPPGRPKDDDAA
jgi:hypothetical protein